jgi:hypothetical protein
LEERLKHTNLLPMDSSSMESSIEEEESNETIQELEKLVTASSYRCHQNRPFTSLCRWKTIPYYKGPYSRAHTVPFLYELVVQG